VRSELRFDGWHLLRGLDRQKDQSYFLHRLTQAQLDASLFPLGDVSRKGVEAYARDKGLPVSAGRSSQDLCFVQDEGYIPLIRKYYTELPGKGHIRDGDGRVLGEHEGHYRYTVGQRKGLGIAVGEPMYVLEICPETNEVFVGTREQGQQRLCRIRDIQWIQPERHKQDEYRLSVRIRYRHQAAPARLRVQGTNRGEIEFDEPQFAVTPGQAAVFYNDEEVLGGGWIECPHTHFAVDH
jgi:tRNA-specific 2-thiouridylase